jgi:hypothetical protein
MIMDQSHLEFVAPSARTLIVDGSTVVISPMDTRMLAQLLKLLHPIMDDVVLVLGNEMMWARLQAGTPEPSDLVDLASLIAQHADPVLAATALLARQEPAWVDQLLPDRTVRLLVEVISVNADFFRQAIPQFKALAARRSTKNDQAEPPATPPR